MSAASSAESIVKFYKLSSKLINCYDFFLKLWEISKISQNLSSNFPEIVQNFVKSYFPKLTEILPKFHKIYCNWPKFRKIYCNWPKFHETDFEFRWKLIVVQNCLIMHACLIFQKKNPRWKSKIILFWIFLLTRCCRRSGSSIENTLQEFAYKTTEVDFHMVIIFNKLLEINTS